MKGKFFKIALPLLFGGAILYWMYRDFDFRHVGDVMLHEMDWTWMLLSLPFGILAQMFRGIRWRQTLEPLGEHSRTSTRVNAVFLSYATSLVVPRIGEFVRCGVLRPNPSGNAARDVSSVELSSYPSLAFRPQRYIKSANLAKISADYKNGKLNVTYWKSLLFIMSSFHYRCLKVELSERNLVRVCIPNSYDFGDQSRTRLVDECSTFDLAKGNGSAICIHL